MLGEHTDEILREYLGYSPDRIATLRAANIVKNSDRWILTRPPSSRRTCWRAKPCSGAAARTTRPRCCDGARSSIILALAALALRLLPLDSSLAAARRVNSILLAILVVILIAEAIVFHSYLSNTFYGVTNQRVIIVSGCEKRELAAVLLDLLNTPRLIASGAYTHMWNCAHRSTLQELSALH